jgi:leucyl-tRNA synthetase
MVDTWSWRFDCIGSFSSFEAKHLVESEENIRFPSTENAFYITLPLDLTKEQIEEIVMKDEEH